MNVAMRRIVSFRLKHSRNVQPFTASIIFAFHLWWFSICTLAKQTSTLSTVCVLVSITVQVLINCTWIWCNKSTLFTTDVHFFLHFLPKIYLEFFCRCTDSFPACPVSATKLLSLLHSCLRGFNYDCTRQRTGTGHKFEISLSFFWSFSHFQYSQLSSFWRWTHEWQKHVGGYYVVKLHS